MYTGTCATRWWNTLARRSFHWRTASEDTSEYSSSLTPSGCSSARFSSSPVGGLTDRIRIFLLQPMRLCVCRGLLVAGWLNWFVYLCDCECSCSTWNGRNFKKAWERLGLWPMNNRFGDQDLSSLFGMSIFASALTPGECKNKISLVAIVPLSTFTNPYNMATFWCIMRVIFNVFVIAVYIL